MTDNSQKAQCKHCFHFLSVGSNTTLRNHITHPHCEAKKAQQNQNPEAGQTSMARDGSVFRYDPDYLREQFAGLAIQERYVSTTLTIANKRGVFQNHMNKFTHVSRSTLKRDAMKLWLAAKQEIIDSFEKPCLRPNWDVPTRWNSTYHMFLSGLKQQTTLGYFHDILANKNRCNRFPAENWVIIQSLTQLLEVFNTATEILSGVYYPTSPLVLQQIFFMSTVLSEYELEGGILSSMIKPMKKKLRKYFQHMPPIITCAAALNPCFNVNGVDFLIESISTDLEFFDDSFASKSKSYFKESLEGLYNLYYAKYGNPTQSSQTSGGATSAKASGRNKYSRLLSG
ncbi:zinc finger BED domain-containing protein RICESLEEPER 2-like protein [Tanacetum coccineum]